MQDFYCKDEQTSTKRKAIL